jgi:hypothetical protein
MFGNFVSIWDTHENERVKIGIKTCRDLSIVPIHGPCGMENCIIVLIEIVNENCEQRKLLYPIPSARYFGSIIRMEVFWPCKYLSMNDEVVKMSIK